VGGLGGRGEGPRVGVQSFFLDKLLGDEGIVGAQSDFPGVLSIFIMVLEDSRLVAEIKLPVSGEFLNK